ASVSGRLSRRLADGCDYLFRHRDSRLCDGRRRGSRDERQYWQDAVVCFPGAGGAVCDCGFGAVRRRVKEATDRGTFSSSFPVPRSRVDGGIPGAILELMAGGLPFSKMHSWHGPSAPPVWLPSIVRRMEALCTSC